MLKFLEAIHKMLEVFSNFLFKYLFFSVLSSSSWALIICRCSPWCSTGFLGFVHFSLFSFLLFILGNLNLPVFSLESFFCLLEFDFEPPLEKIFISVIVFFKSRISLWFLFKIPVSVDSIDLVRHHSHTFL